MKNRNKILMALMLVLACFALLPGAQAVVPPPDGGYPGFNTAEGQNALLNLNPALSLGNTAIGWKSLFSAVVANNNTGVGTGALALNNGNSNTAVGSAAMLLNTLGQENTAVGVGALINNATASFNTANGAFALSSNTTGDFNTANGAYALSSNTTGFENTATGESALYSNTQGHNNTANGKDALFSNTTGTNNTATGYQALFSNTNGGNHTAVGYQALASSSTGSSWNTALGANALTANTTGDGNTATGYYALLGSDTGSYNTANGGYALAENNDGNYNTAIGWQALWDSRTGSYNTANGGGALENNTDGNYNTAIGWQAGQSSTGSGNIYIGAGVGGTGGDSGVIRIGDGENIFSGYSDTFIQGIFGNTIGVSGVAVYVDSLGQLGTTPSSRRFKDAIKPMDKASEAIMALKPVTFHYKSDKTNRPQFGLVAEEVAEVNPDLVVRDKKGEIYTVRYEQINAMLLNEFLKEHKTVQELKTEIAALASTVKEQAAQIQKVSAQLEVSKPAPQVVVNKP